MNVLFLGAPGSGKGTQAKKIEAEFTIPQISTGDLLRAETASGSDIGEELKIIMSSGKFVSDDIVLKLVSKKSRLMIVRMVLFLMVSQEIYLRPLVSICY